MKLTHMASTSTGWKRMGESRNGGIAPETIDIACIGRCDHTGTGIGVGNTHSYTRKITKQAINSELNERGYDFVMMPAHKETHITRVDGVYIIHDWRARTFTREA